MKLDDSELMRLAFELAENGRGAVEPNPLVGAVVFDGADIVGQGYHARFGGDHAEVIAIRDAGAKANGSELFVTLEPCCHQGKTPPCTDLILKSGIRRVVYALEDPFPKVGGRGGQQLEAAGIDVSAGLMEQQARAQNAAYLKLQSRSRPYVHLKWAMSLDGKIATRSGNSQWISNPESRRLVHQLRGRMDAIVVGAGTVRLDDPLLTARPPGPRQATRIVLCGKRAPEDHWQLIKTSDQAPVLLVLPNPQDRKQIAHLRGLGCESLVLRSAARTDQVLELLDHLGSRQMTNVMVEGGSEVHASFLECGEVDELHVFVAPLLVGGSTATTAIGGSGVALIDDAHRFAVRELNNLDGDCYIRLSRGEPAASTTTGDAPN